MRFKKILVFLLIMAQVFSMSVFAATPSKSVADRGLQVSYHEGVPDQAAISALLASIDSKPVAKNTIDLRAAAVTSPNGAAWAYRSVTSKTINCYAYAANLALTLNPGDIAYVGGKLKWGDSVSTVANLVIADMGRASRTSRIISSATASVNADEYRIAVRVGRAIVDGGDTYDYHFMLQCSDGGWCHKPGSTPSAYLGKINPSTYSWDLKRNDGSVAKYNFYNSSTIYIAVKK